MNPLRVAVIGAGVMGKHHANIYAALPNVELAAVVDPLPERREEAARAHACNVYPSLDALLTHERIDAASVTAPTSLHYRLVRELLEAGVHVMVEKPVATSVQEAERLAQLSRVRGLVLQVGHITRFYKAVKLLSESVRDPYLIEARRLTPHARISDVGVILDLMIHDIDIILGLVAAPVRSLAVAGRRAQGGQFEDVAAAQITFEDGCIARLLASRAAPEAERNLVVTTTEQTVRLDFSRDPHTDLSFYRPEAGNGNANRVVIDRRTVHEDNPLRKELEHFLARILLGEPPVGTLEDDLRSLELATRLLEEIEFAPVELV